MTQVHYSLIWNCLMCFLQLKEQYPEIDVPLPKKKWFGDNFNANFLDERVDRLQELVNCIIENQTLLSDSNVRDFFCLDEPPSVTDSVEETKVFKK